MTILTDNRTEFEIDEFIELFEQVAEKTLEKEGFPQNTEISISIVTNEEIRNINKYYRGIDQETDVLSFPQLTFSENEEYELNENGDIMLGDIIISYEKALVQAENYGHSITREMAFLTAHSMLHLLGYDHITKEEEEPMFKLQNEILDELGYVREV